jgi:hypothetical protein
MEMEQVKCSFCGNATGVAKKQVENVVAKPAAPIWCQWGWVLQCQQCLTTMEMSATKCRLCGQATGGVEKSG